MTRDELREKIADKIRKDEERWEKIRKEGEMADIVFAWGVKFSIAGVALAFAIFFAKWFWTCCH